MSQANNVLATSDTLTASRALINDNFAALRSLNAGTSAPSSPVEGMIYAKTDTNVVYCYTGGAWVAIIPDYTAAGGGLLPLTGGTMSGAIAMGSNQITGLAVGSASTDATTKGQVDARVLVGTVLIDGLSATANVPIGVVPQAGTVSKVYLVSDTTTSGSGAGNRWDFNVRNVTQAENLKAADKTTNGAEITLEVAYDLGLDQNLTGLAAGDVLRLTVTKTGAPTSLSSARILVAIHYTVTT